MAKTAFDTGTIGMRVGFIGLGNVGGKLARSLLRNGVSLITRFDELGTQHGVPLELSPVVVAAEADGLERYGPRVWSSSVVKRLEDDCDTDVRAPGFANVLIDDQPETAGAEVVGVRAYRG